MVLYGENVFSLTPFKASSDINYQAIITGKVTAENGESIPGVNVLVKGTLVGSVSDFDGNYSINVTGQNAVLMFSYIGFKTLEMPVNGQSVINVTMAEDFQSLDEVVVVGYGTLDRSKITTAISTVKGDELLERPSSISIAQGLSGKVAGVNVMTNSGKPGGLPAIRIRGTGSINTSSSPLYVVDGIVGADPNTIDPNIVESINILKDASSAAIYGARGANGVIVITTKKGRSGSFEVMYSGSTSAGTQQREVDLLDANGAAEMFRKQYDYPYRDDPNTPRPAPHMPGGADFPRKADLFNPDGTPIYNTNWQRESTRMAISHSHSLTFTGGKDDLTVLANISYRNMQGIMLNSYEKRINAYINIGWKVKPWLHVQGSINTGANQGNNVDLNPLSSTALRKMYEMLPFLPVKYPDGTYSRQGDYLGAEDSENPVRLLNEIEDVVGGTYSLVNFVNTIKLSENLDFVVTLGGQTSAGYDFYYAGTQLRGVSETQKGVASRMHSNIGSWNNENYLNYHNTFGKHLIDVTAGASWYYKRSTSTTSEAQNFFDDYYKYNTLQAGSNPRPSSSTPLGNQFNSVYARANYSFDNRYLLGGSYRIDGSSRFGDNNKYGHFPSVSIGWNISNEEFFSSANETINNFKIRASYGEVGNAELADYQTLARLTTAQTTFNDQAVTGVTLGSMANPDLSWETSSQLDFGIDLGLFQGRINIVADYYIKKNTDLLYFKKLPSTTGFSGVMTNIGDIQNKGFEIQLNTINILNDDFRWSTGINFTQNKNEVLNLNGDILYPWSGRIMEGRPLNEFFGFVREGIWGTNEQAEAASYGKLPGDVKWQDTNNNGAKDLDDRVVLGNGMPKWEANMINTFSFKGLSLLIDLQGMYGLSLGNTTKHLMQGASTRVNSYTVILDAWTPDNQNTIIPALRTPQDHSSPSEVADSYAVEDASFIRVRNVGLSYDFNSDWLRTLHLNRLTIGVNAENALLFTRYSGMDPEYTSMGAQLEQGVDIYQYPKPRTISINLNVNF